MSVHKLNESGFSIVELLIALLLAVMVSVIFITFFRTSLVQYLNIQKDGTTATALAAQEARLANVLRGTTSVVSASGNDLVLYAYFYPSDAYVSKLHYYVLNSQLLATMTPMTANPPTGTPIAASAKTYTIISNLYQNGTTPLFAYIDSSNTALATPVSDLNAIKQIQVNLAATASNGGNQSMNLQVVLRNMKTNL
jgi:type II secretory pathway pseudopilin PulG